MLSLHSRSFLRRIRKDWEVYCLQFLTLSLAFATAIIVVSFVSRDLNGGRDFYDNVKYGEPYCVLILTCISALIIILALTNFVNLVSLTLPSRAKELAMRKVAGSQKPPLLGLLTKESGMIVTISLIIAVSILIVSINPTKTYLSIDLIDWLKSNTIASVSILIGLVVVITIAPLIPAWAFVKASPGRLLSTDAITFPRMKKVITFIQLGVSISLIIASLVIDRQISRSLIREPGKNHEQIVYVKRPRDMSSEYFIRLKDQWPLTNPHIVMVIGVSQTPDNLSSKNVGDDHFNIIVDYDFKDFFEVDMISGHWFGPNDSDKTIANTKGEYVIGNFFSKNNLPEVPLKITLNQDKFNYIMIRVLEVDIRNTIPLIERDFGHVTFLNKNYEKIVAYEDQLNKLSSLLAIISCVMAVCAIYALSLSRMNDNIKQIAIRKTFGASNSQIVGRLSLSFFELMLASLFFFGPVTYILLREWLRNFAYSAKFNWADPLIAIGICIVIVAVTNLLLIMRLRTTSLSQIHRA